MGWPRFDGTQLYEHADPREGFHQDWNTLIYNYGRREVANYLTSNALYWLEEYHVDGLRVDAVASMLYRDYSRSEGQWVPNEDGGRENYEAIAMLQTMNREAYGEYPGIMTVAEESTSFPGVAARARRRARLRLQVEHGLDERHAVATSRRTRSTASTITTR